MENEEELKAKARALSIKEGIAASVSGSFGNHYITPYALALKASNLHIGLLSSLPTLLGNFSQLFTPKVMERKSRKAIAFSGALLQALMWIPLLALIILFYKVPAIAPVLLIPIYSLLIVFGAFFGPAWTSWMKDLVTEKPGRYFSMRNRICSFIALVSMLVAGFILDWFKRTALFLGFVVLFGIAFAARVTSAFLFTKMYEPEFKVEKSYYFSFWQFLRKAPSSNFGRFVLFLTMMNFAVAIASPFFAVYMLKHLGFSYSTWIGVVISASVTTILFLPLWGRFADKYGNLRTIKITGCVLPAIPLFWLFSARLDGAALIFYLVMIEAFSGFVWAGFNISTSNFVYDAVTRQRMGLCSAYLAVLTGIGTFLGATIGGLISTNQSNFGVSAILFLFLLSGILRLCALAWLPKLREVRDVEPFSLKELKKKITTLTPTRLLSYLELSLKKA